MYINLSVLGKSGLEYSDLVFLAAINQTETEWLIENFKDSDYERFERLSFIKHIKQKSKKEHLYTSLRLSDLGKSLLSEIEEAPIEEEDKTVFEWLKNYYLKAGKEIGNGAKTQRHIRDFRIKSGIQKNNLIKLVLDFLAENEERSKKLEYIWYYPKTAFATRFDLEESWLWSHFIRNKERLEKTFEQY
jgi:hypothetical protein